jgi:hypothetical protein
MKMKNNFPEPLGYSRGNSKREVCSYDCLTLKIREGWHNGSSGKVPA